MKHLLLLSVLLLGVTWVAAQDTSSPSQSPSSSGSSQTGSATSGSSQSSSGQMGSESSGSKQSVEGCLSGSDGKYTLTDKQGTTYQLTGDTSKLAEHVGHEVKITGSSSGAGSASAGSSASSGGGQTLDVKSVKHVSKTCSSGGGMSK